MFGLSHVVRQRLNTSLTINTQTSDTGAPRQTVFSILSFSHLEKSPSHDPSITTYSKSTQHYLFTYLMCSNNICKAEKQIKANHFLRTPDIFSDIQVILPVFFCQMSKGYEIQTTRSVAIIQKKVH